MFYDFSVDVMVFFYLKYSSVFGKPLHVGIRLNSNIKTYFIMEKVSYKLLHQCKIIR